MERFKIRVEKVYANSYHQNLLLNLPKILLANKQITTVSLRRLKPQTESYILQWEDYNGVFLPNDIKDFYLAHDGFLFLWTYNPIPEGSPVQCGIHVNGLNELDAITGYEVTTKAGISMKNGRKALALSVNSRVFELEPMGDDACVCLVYYNVWLRPTVWLWSKGNGFFFLSNDFSKYFRMCIAHLGIIGWQYTFSTNVLSKWTRRIMRKLGPHLLRSPYDYIVQQCQSNDNQSRIHTTLEQDNRNGQMQTKNPSTVKDVSEAFVWKSRQQSDEEREIVINKLDPNVFINTTSSCPSWVSISGGGGAGRTNSKAILVYPLNRKKSRHAAMISNVRSNSALLKKGKSTGKRPHSSRSTSIYYNKRYNLSPKGFRRSKYCTN